MTYKILIVDDEAPNIRLLERVFRNEYQCLKATSGWEAIQLLKEHDVAVLITDQRMPQMSGIELLKSTAEMRPSMVRILLTGYTDIEALVEAVNCGLVYMYISKPWSNDDLKLRVSRAVQHFEDNKRQNSLAAANERLTSQVWDLKRGFVRATAGLLQMKDEDTYRHCFRVSKSAEMLGKSCGLTEGLLTELAAAAFLHDLGFIGATDQLSHERVLGKEQSNALQLLAERAAQVLSFVPDFQDIAELLRYNYESYDGKGHPLGLRSEEIPIMARIIKVANDYDLLTNPRNVEQKLDHSEALEELKARAGKELDPQMVRVFSDLPAEELRNLCESNGGPLRPELITNTLN